MSSTRHDLLGLMPAIHRIRDAEIAAESGLDVGPLEALLSVVARELAVVEEGLEQAYDDLFIETCAPWVVPYIGDLIGYQSLHGDVPEVASPRAEVAHTIGLRRRKGTALVLEQLARDVTRWDARVVEYFQTLSTTQYMNHRRLYNHQAPDLRDSKLLDELGSPFNRVAHTVDVRRIGSGRGRHNIPNIGVHLWRIAAWRHRLSPAVPAGGRRFRVSPLGHDIALFNRPNRLAEDNIEHIADPFNVPRPLRRRSLHRDLAHHYRSGLPAAVAEAGLLLEVDDVQVPVDRIVVCDLSDDGAGWAHEPPPGFFGIDPELGRLSMPPDQPVPAVVRTTYHRGFSAALGGGEYEREATFALNASTDVVRVPDDQPTVSLALAELAGSGTVEITDNGRYEETPILEVSAGATLEVRAANGRQPTLVLGAPMQVIGGPQSRLALNGLWIAGERIEVPDDGVNALSELQLSHLTLVPGQALSPDGMPLAPAEPSMIVGIADVAVTVVRSIVGAVLTHEQSPASFEDCTIDATAPNGVAYAGPVGAPVPGPGGALRLSGCTVIGKVRARTLDWVSNSILLAQVTPGDGWAAPVWSSQKQVGCVRFSYLPFDAITPSRYRCQPDSAATARSRSPGFTSLKFGTPAYCQLSGRAPAEIRRGADNESEMGVFSHLLGPQREANLRIRLGEYLRVGLEAGIFNAT